jgi:hypothetical protein
MEGEREGRERSWTNPQLWPKPPSLLLTFHNERQLQHLGPGDDTDGDDAVLYLVAGRLSHTMQEAGPTPLFTPPRSPVTMPDRLHFQATPLVPIQTIVTH